MVGFELPMSCLEPNLTLYHLFSSSLVGGGGGRVG